MYKVTNRNTKGSTFQIYLESDFLPTHWPDPNHHHFSPGYSHSLLTSLPVSAPAHLTVVDSGPVWPLLKPSNGSPLPSPSKTFLTFLTSPVLPRPLLLFASPGTYPGHPTSGPLTLMFPLPLPFPQDFCRVSLLPYVRALLKYQSGLPLHYKKASPFQPALCYPTLQAVIKRYGGYLNFKNVVQ